MLAKDVSVRQIAMSARLIIAFTSFTFVIKSAKSSDGVRLNPLIAEA